jgi:hypothetical protein
MEAALGNVGLPVTFTNRGTAPCEIGGFPRITAVDNATRQRVTASAEYTGYLLGTSIHNAPRLRLEPDETASTLLEGADNPIGNKTSCSNLIQFRARLTYFTAAFNATFPDCAGMSVSPLVPGNSSRLPS